MVIKIDVRYKITACVVLCLQLTSFKLCIVVFFEKRRTHYKQYLPPKRLDYDYLAKYFRIYVLADHLTGNNLVTPTMINGKKYRTANKELNKK
jgi:hypothetical protein